MESIRARIKELRWKLRLNQGDFASKMGVKQNTWSNIEIGTNPCSERYINLICLTYNVRKEWLLEGQGDVFGALPQNPLADPMLDDTGKPLPPEVADLIKIYQELVPPNQKAVLDFVETTLQAQRNTIKAIARDKNP